MASKDTIQAMLKAFATNYSRRDDWADTVWGTWYKALQSYSDQDVRQVARQVMSERGRVPTVAAFLACMKGNPAVAQPQGPKGCMACDGTGWREVSWHRWDTRRLMVTSYAASCDCEKGRYYEAGAATNWSVVVEKLSSDPSTEAVYSTSASHPRLTIQERYHPDMVAKMKDSQVSRSSGDTVGIKKV